MTYILEPNRIGTALKIGIVVSRFNSLITEKLLAGATQTLISHGVDETDITIAWAPGAFEIPIVAKTMAMHKTYDAVIALGCVIQGATPHFDYVCGETASGLTRASLDTDTPMLFGVLTTDTMEQALERSGGKAGNKGAEAAIAAIETANLINSIVPANTPSLT